MKKLFALALMLIVFCVGNTSTVPVKASPGVLNVGPGQTYPTITAALAAAAPGDVIHVWSGTYDENPVIAIPNIKIIGEKTGGFPMVTVEPATHGNCFTILAPDVTIMSLQIWLWPPQSGDIGIAISGPLGASKCIIMNNIIVNFDWGILISDSPSNQIIDNNICYCNVNPPPPFCSTGVFIYGPNSINNVVRGNELFDNVLHVQTNQASGNTITFNNILWTSPIDNSPQASVVPGDINIWCDVGLGKGNYWTDPLIPHPPYVIDPNNADPFCSPARYDWNTMPWDINRDLKCDIKDVATAAVAFGAAWSAPRWNPAADITGPSGPDGIVNIRDIALVASKFGWSDP